MKKFLIIFVLILYSTLSGCNLPKKCNPRYNVTEEQVRLDLENNKQDYLNFIDLTQKKELKLLKIIYDETIYPDKEIYVSYYLGSEDEIGTEYFNFDNTKTLQLNNFDLLSETEKETIKSFILNRNSKEVNIFFSPAQEMLSFEFWGLTYIAYSNEEFQIIERPCFNK